MRTIKIGSVTRASRAKEILERSHIRAEIRKLGEQQDGCVHAVTVNDEAVDEALQQLTAAGIKGTLFDKPQ